MGIDIYLKWDGMTEEDQQKQYTGMSTISGEVGYLREAYHGGPYATKILCREAFETDNCEAQIPAETLRERLTHVTEPVIGANGGHMAAAMFSELMKTSGMAVSGQVLSDITCPMTVEEAIRERYKRLYPDAGTEEVDRVVQSFQDFVALAERKEAETGKPCTIYASY
jgi:hypothetical protein